MALKTRVQRQIDELRVQLDKLNEIPNLEEFEAWLETELPLSSIALSDSIDIHLSGTKKELIKLWAKLRRMGYALNSDLSPPQPGQASWAGYFDLAQDKRTAHSLAFEDEPLRIWVHFSSTVCRQVKTGTRLVEEPIYTIICNDETPAVAEAEPADDIPF